MEFFWLWIGTLIVSLAVFAGIMLFGIIGQFYETWQMGREIGQFITEKSHQRRLELLTKMIELEQPYLQGVVNEQSPDTRSSVPDGEGVVGDSSELPSPGGTGCLRGILRDLQTQSGELRDASGQDEKSPETIN